ncbi:MULTISPECIES: nuclear transport factor 2 family protein [unclassified Streptomyces]|uniref:nuclear transport factor 2 family protein n=1 Tax=unclassified Streptomyces TaxID=2593676 RepID=UPI002E80C81E|nr:nuclear transport factor 2 family protein [Streptomyces sp. NBC_00589]WTI33722.1 nuclear transport factor 2 family protein [Streptomyces sp. NBC_00775]WUB32606.1 nuclear transport factor 2 family protein [Streptomyces sp. NBC_00589]
MTTGAPREVLQLFLRLTADGPNEAMADLFTTDAVLEMPYLPPGAPAQEPGRDAFRAHLQEGAKLQKFTAVDHVHVHETADPELVIADYRLHGRILATGKQFTFDMVQFVRVRDGLITWSRTYSNPLDGAIAFDATEGLLAAITAA